MIRLPQQFPRVFLLYSIKIGLDQTLNQINFEVNHRQISLLADVGVVK